MTTASPSKASHFLQPTRQQALFAFIVLLTINILNYMDRTILPAVLSSLNQDFHLDDTQSGLLGSSFLIIYGIATLPLGIWADRSVRKNIVGLCVGLWSVATSLAGFTQNFIQLFITRAFLGVGEAGYAPASLSMIGDFFPKGQRGRILSLWSVSNLFGTALGLAVGGVVAHYLNWRWAFYIVGIPGLIMAFLIWRAHEPQRGAFDHEGSGDDSAATAGHGNLLSKDFLVQVGQIFRIPTYWILLAAFIFSFFIVGAAQFWIPNYFERAFHLDSGQAGPLAGGVLAGGALVGTLIGGWLADMLQKRVPQGRMLISTLAFLVGAPLTALALAMQELIPFICVFIVAIICLSMCLGPINAILQDIIAPGLRATGVGLALLLAHLLGDASSPTIIGAISNSTSLGFALLITAPTCLLLAGLICLIGLKTVARDMARMQESLQRSPE
ncbi:MAG: MFS transporter [Ktedonobacteraceae bacterium]|nr:MFS transporter [Ktedonobacteraceae bacterium]